MKFWLGTHEPGWLGRVDIPLFISHRRLLRRSRLPTASGPWALDSGGFSELSLYGEWKTTAQDYVASVLNYSSTIGHLAWAAPMDWMCEPHILSKTGLSIVTHQQKTVENYLHLRELAPEVPFIPVIQGWSISDYLHCVDLYEQHGVDLTKQNLVGVGSVCRRQSTTEAERILEVLHQQGLKLHGFGVKTKGLSKYVSFLASADSLAWSFRARNAQPLPGCTHVSCSNCLRFALLWREKVLSRLAHQERFFFS